MKKMEEIPFTEQQKEFLQLDKLQNPQLLVLNHKNIKNIHQLEHTLISSDLYTITLNLGIIDSLKYGRNYYDFKDGTLIFLTPGQTFMIEKLNIDDFSEGWSLHFHPNLVRNSSLYEKLKSYTFFSYNINEALHVKKEEKEVITTLIKAIEQESSTKLDANTQNILIAYIDLLLSYCNRFYERQFNTRKVLNKDTASRFEKLLKDYYDNRLQFEHGLPTPRYCAEALCLSQNYFNDLLKEETGKTTTNHIHYFILEKAKDLLLQSDMTISELSDFLGFKYPQHFCNLFKEKTGISAADFRKSKK